MKIMNLSTDQAILMQVISENGTEDFDDLSESLRFGPRYTRHLLQNLQHKGLVKIQGSWISLSIKGQKASQLIWPETTYLHYN